jgi:sodium/bile acid cotransporter 7
LPISSTLKRFGLDGFLLGIIAMVVLAYFFPSIGMTEEPISLGELANYGISVIFLFYGMRLGPEKLKAGLVNWRMHALVQSVTFIFFPLLAIAIKPLFGGNQELWFGIFYLAALPSTVSSSVVMVSIAKGNMPAAIFNASISSLAGVFITPLWMGLFLTADKGFSNTGDIIMKLMLQILLPVIIGILLNKRFGAFAEKHKARLRYFDQSIILVIIYTSFCHSFAEHVFDQYSPLNIALLALGMVGLFFFVFLVIWGISKLLHFSVEDRITVLFCGSKKSLVHGTVMVKVLFPNAANTGIILLPLMMYHALQLVFASIIARSMANRSALPKTEKI